MSRTSMFTISSDEENQYIVSYAVTEDRHDLMPFGLSATMKDREGSVVDRSAVRNRFATEEEASAIMYILCRKTVTPCTLPDILS